MSGDGEGRDNFLTCYKFTTFLYVLDITPCERSVEAMDSGGSVEVGGGRWRVWMTPETDVTQTVKDDVPDVPL